MTRYVRKFSKTATTLEERPNGTYPFKLFLLLLGPIYAQNMSSNGRYQLERFPCEIKIGVDLEI